VARTVDAAMRSYVEMGKPKLFDQIAVNPAEPVNDRRALSIRVIIDAAEDGVTAHGCAKGPVRKGDVLDALSVRGGCVVIATDRMEIRCSAEAVRIFGEIRQRPGRAHPALLYVLAHELGHLLQRRPGEYAARVERVDLNASRTTKLEMLRTSCDPAST